MKPDYLYKDWKAGDIGINEHGNIFLCLDNERATWVLSNFQTQLRFAPNDKSASVNIKNCTQEGYGVGYIGNIEDFFRNLENKLDYKR